MSAFATGHGPFMRMTTPSLVIGSMLSRVQLPGITPPWPHHSRPSGRTDRAQWKPKSLTPGRNNMSARATVLGASTRAPNTPAPRPPFNHMIMNFPRSRADARRLPMGYGVTPRSLVGALFAYPIAVC